MRVIKARPTASGFSRSIIWMASALLELSSATAGSQGSQLHPTFDFHSHVQSEAVVQVMKRACSRNPPMCPPSPPQPRTGTDVIRDLNDAHIGRSIILSTAYMFGLPELRDDRMDVAGLVHRENLWVVSQAIGNKRLVPIISVPVLDPSAPAELDYWAAHAEVPAIKLHLTTAGFSFRRSQDVARLALVFGKAAAAHKGIVIHMRTLDPGYGSEDVQTFLDDVVPSAKGMPIQIAHLGGWGGFDRKTEAALQTFVAAADQHKLPSNLYLEISAVAMPGVSRERLAIAASMLRRIGLRRVIWGSDSGLDMTPSRAWQLASSGFPFTATEWRKILSNKPGYVR